MVAVISRWTFTLWFGLALLPVWGFGNFADTLVSGSFCDSCNFHSIQNSNDLFSIKLPAGSLIPVINQIQQAETTGSILPPIHSDPGSPFGDAGELTFIHPDDPVRLRRIVLIQEKPQLQVIEKRLHSTESVPHIRKLIVVLLEDIIRSFELQAPGCYGSERLSLSSGISLQNPVMYQIILGMLQAMGEELSGFAIVEESHGIYVYIWDQNHQVRRLDERQVFLMYGNWFDKNIYRRLLEHFETDSGCYYYPHHSGDKVPPPAHPPQKSQRKPVKGDSPDSTPEAVDGQGGSRSAKKTSPDGGDPGSNPSDPAAVKNKGEPVPTERASPYYKQQKAKAEPPKSRRPIKYQVVKALNRILKKQKEASEDMKALAKHVNDLQLKDHFHDVRGLPDSKPKQQITFLLQQGYITQLSEYLVDNVPYATLSSLGRQARRVRDRSSFRFQHTRRGTRVVRSKHSQYLNESLSLTLATLTDRKKQEATVQELTPQASGKVLRDALNKRWQVVVQTSSPIIQLVNSAKLFQLLKEQSVSLQDREDLVVAHIQHAAGFVVSSDQEQLLAHALNLLPVDLEESISQEMESSGTRIGSIETEYGLSPLVRITDLSTAALGYVSLGEADKHLQIIIDDKKPEAVRWLIKVTVSFETLTIRDAAGTVTDHPVSILLRRDYEFFPGSRQVIELSGRSTSEISFEPPEVPDRDGIQAMRDRIRESAQQELVKLQAEKEAYLQEAEELLDTGQQHSVESLNKVNQKLAKILQVYDRLLGKARTMGLDEQVANALSLVERTREVLQKYEESLRMVASPEAGSSSPQMVPLSNSEPDSYDALVMDYWRAILAIVNHYYRLAHIYDTNPTMTPALRDQLSALNKEYEELAEFVRTPSLTINGIAYRTLISRLRAMTAAGLLTTAQQASISTLKNLHHPFGSIRAILNRELNLLEPDSPVSVIAPIDIPPEDEGATAQEQPAEETVSPGHAVVNTEPFVFVEDLSPEEVDTPSSSSEEEEEDQ